MNAEMETIFNLRSSFSPNVGLNKDASFQAMQEYSAIMEWNAEQRIRDQFYPIISNLINSLESIGYGNIKTVMDAKQILQTNKYIIL